MIQTLTGESLREAIRQQEAARSTTALRPHAHGLPPSLRRQMRLPSDKEGSAPDRHRGNRRTQRRGPSGTVHGLRLTRRGRVLLIATTCALALPALGVTADAVAGEVSGPREVTVVTVAPGDTLWRFAEQLAKPGQDIRDVVDNLRLLNALPSAELRAGQTILLPLD